MAVGDVYMFPWLSNTSTNTTFCPKPPTPFLTCFSRNEGRKYALIKKVRLSNSQPPGHEFDTLTTEPTGRGTKGVKSSLFCDVNPQPAR